MKKLLVFLFVLPLLAKAQFAVDSTSTIRGITIDLPGESYFGQGITRKARLIRKTEDADLNITILIHIDCYDAQGRRILDVIEKDSLSPETAKQLMRTRFATFGFTKTTRDSWVLANGTPTTKGTPGAMPELFWFQQLTWQNLAAMGLPVTATTPQLRNQYWMLVAMMQQLIVRNGL